MSENTSKLSIFDSAYVRICDLVFNYSSLLSSIGTGFLFADRGSISNTIGLDLKGRAAVIGLAFSVAGPGVEKEFLTRQISAREYYGTQYFEDKRNTGSDPIEDYPFWEGLRNVYAGIGSLLLTRAYQNNSSTTALVGLFFAALATDAEIRSQKSRRNLVSIIKNLRIVSL